MEIKTADILEYNEPLTKALNIILTKGTAVIITKNGKYFGIISDRNIRTGISDPSTTKCESSVIRAPVIYPDSEVMEYLKAFLNGHYKTLPVLDKKSGKVIGMTTRVEMLQELLGLNMIPRERVEDLMKTPVYTITYESTIGDTKNKLKKYKVHRLLVTRAGKPVGIIGTFDLSAPLIKPKGRSKASIITDVKGLGGIKVSEMLRERIINVQVNESLEDTARKMIKHDVSSVLIMSGEKAVGILSAMDLFTRVNSSLKKKPLIRISGLKEEDDGYYSKIQKSFGRLVKKYSKTFEIGEISIHLKKGKSAYQGKLKIMVNNSPLTLSYEKHELEYVINGLSDEMDKVLRRRKDYKRSKKRRKP